MKPTLWIEPILNPRKEKNNANLSFSIVDFFAIVSVVAAIVSIIYGTLAWKEIKINEQLIEKSISEITKIRDQIKLIESESTTNHNESVEI